MFQMKSSEIIDPVGYVTALYLEEMSAHDDITKVKERFHGKI